MSPEEITELEELKKHYLTKSGKPRKDARPEILERLNQLQEKFDVEHAAELPDDARIETPMKVIDLNVCGKKVFETVRDNRR